MCPAPARSGRNGAFPSPTSSSGRRTRSQTAKNSASPGAQGHERHMGRAGRVPHRGRAEAASVQTPSASPLVPLGRPFSPLGPAASCLPAFTGSQPDLGKRGHTQAPRGAYFCAHVRTGARTRACAGNEEALTGDGGAPLPGDSPARLVWDRRAQPLKVSWARSSHHVHNCSAIL